MPSELKCIPGYPGYYVCEEGHVYSNKTGKVLRKKPHFHADGYYQVRIGIPGKVVSLKVHALVALAFLGDRPEGAVVRHLNSQCLDNRPENLAYGSQQENVQDAIQAGTFPRGTTNGRAKFTEEQVREIRDSSEGTTALSRRFGVDGKTIRNIRAGIYWKHVG